MMSATPAIFLALNFSFHTMRLITAVSATAALVQIAYAKPKGRDANTCESA